MTKTLGANLLGLFLGVIEDVQRRNDYIIYCVRRPGEEAFKVTTLHSIKESDFEYVENVFTDALWELPYNDHTLLWIVWVRDDIFGAGALKEVEKISLAQSVFTLNGVSVDAELLEEGFKTLVRERYLQKMTGESGADEYHLTTKARKFVKTMFKKTEDGTLAYVNLLPIVPGSDTVDCTRMKQAAVNVGNLGGSSDSVVKAINQLPAKMSRVLLRFKKPLGGDDVEEDEMEMIDFNYQSGVKWKDNVMAVFPNIPEDELETKVDSIRKQHRKEFPESYKK